MKNTSRKPYRSDLTDKQWQRIKPLLPKLAHTGRPKVDDREVINGILYVLVTGCGWEYLPHDIAASYQTCPKPLARLSTPSRVAENLASVERSLLQRQDQFEECTPMTPAWSRQKGGAQSSRFLRKTANLRHKTAHGRCGSRSSVELYDLESQLARSTKVT